MHRNGYEGVCVFRRRGTSEDGLRGARFSAVGLLVGNIPNCIIDSLQRVNGRSQKNPLDQGHGGT